MGRYFFESCMKCKTRLQEVEEVKSRVDYKGDNKRVTEDTPYIKPPKSEHKKLVII